MGGPAPTDPHKHDALFLILASMPRLTSVTLTFVVVDHHFLSDSYPDRLGLLESFAAAATPSSIRSCAVYYDVDARLATTECCWGCDGDTGHAPLLFGRWRLGERVLME